MLDFATLAPLLAAHDRALHHPVRSFSIGDRAVDFERERLVMGVLNLSPDSWHSVCRTEAEAFTFIDQLTRDGVDIIDIGAESTMPDTDRVDAAGQIERLGPVVDYAVAAGALVSVESYLPEVLEAAGRRGAQVFNVTGTAGYDDIFALARRFEATVVLCYMNAEHSRATEALGGLDDWIPRQEAYFRALLGQAEAAGVPRVIVDPGLGFYYRDLSDPEVKARWHIETLVQTFRLKALGVPLLNITPVAPGVFDDAVYRVAEPFYAVLGFLGGAHVLRTHEVEAVARIRHALNLPEGPL